MCGIVGLFGKSPELEEQLGTYLAAMLMQMSDRGPDSAGVAVYRDPAPEGSSKLTLFSADPAQDWWALCAELEAEFGGAPTPGPRANHAVLTVETDAASAEAWIRRVHPELRVMSSGRRGGGASLGRARGGGPAVLEGFYPFAAGPAGGFAVLRAPIAGKPAVLAETDDWVAMSSEYRAISVLPGATEARIWEPEPGV